MPGDAPDLRTCFLKKEYILLLYLKRKQVRKSAAEPVSNFWRSPHTSAQDPPKVSQRGPEKVQRAVKGMPRRPQVSPQGSQLGIKKPQRCHKGVKDDPAGSPQQARGGPKGALARMSIRRQQIALGVGTDLEPRHEKKQEKIPRLFLRQPSWFIEIYTLVVNQIVSTAAWRTWYHSLNAPPHDRLEAHLKLDP